MTYGCLARLHVAFDGSRGWEFAWRGNKFGLGGNRHLADCLSWLAGECWQFLTRLLRPGFFDQLHPGPGFGTLAGAAARHDHAGRAILLSARRALPEPENLEPEPTAWTSDG